MAITLVRALEMLGRATGLFASGTSDGSGSTTTLVDAVQVYRHDINTLKNKWLYIVNSSNDTVDNTSRRISDVHASNGTITVDAAFAATTASGTTYYITAYDPDIMRDSLQQAARTLYPHIYLPTQDETIVVDNLISNWDFETWSATTASAGSGNAVATSWSSVGTPSKDDNTAFVTHGSYSIKIAATGATEGVEQNIISVAGVNINETESKILHVRGWVWCDVADAARLRVTYDGSTFDNSNYHSGSAEWEGPALMYIDSAIDFTASSTEEMTISCEVTSGNTAYFDGVVAWIDNVHTYDLPSTVIRGPHKVSIQANQSEPNGDYEPLATPQSGRILRIEHMGTLTVPTTSASIEIDESRGELLIAQAAAHMFQTLAMTDSGNSSIHIQQADTWQSRADRLLSQPGMRMKGMSAHERKTWRVVESGETRKLALSGRW